MKTDSRRSGWIGTKHPVDCTVWVPAPRASGGRLPPKMTVSTTLLQTDAKPSNIVFVQGDLFEDDAEVLVNPVNCRGVAGAGLAKQFRTRLPWSIHAYRAAFLRGEVQPGRVVLCRPPARSGEPMVTHLPTKRDWRDDARLDDVEAGLQDLRRLLRELPVESVALPRLGCGLGRLAWSDVRVLIESILGDLDGVEVRVYSNS